MLLAFDAVQPTKIPNVSALMHQATARLTDTLSDGPLTVDFIQDCIEQVLLESGHFDVARHYIKYRAERDQARQERLNPDGSAICDYINDSKYAKYLPDKQRRETYYETVQRSLNMHLKKFPEYEDDIRQAFEFVYDREVLPSMRGMQFAGEAAELINARMYNCSFTLMDRVRAFQEAFYLLLCGCGVGYSVQLQHIKKLPEVVAIDPKKVDHHVVADSIEGWAEAVGHLMACFFYKGTWPEFAYHKIRPEGALLKTSGGRAPGHLPLKRAIDTIFSILKAAEGRQLRSLEVHDILCFLAEAVLAGGIRRSSLISLFTHTDTEMLYCKTKGKYRQAYGSDPGLNSQREMANNSGVLLRATATYDEFVNLVRIAQSNFGCPGFFFTDNLDHGTNPCGEIGLNPTFVFANGQTATGWSFCNLTEINGATAVDQADFVERAEAAALIGTLQASMNKFPYLGRTTELIAQRDNLLGVSITGMLDNPSLCLAPRTLSAAAAAAVAVNKKYAPLFGIKPAKRVTTIKPSGTASLALGAIGSGIHPSHARRYFRRVTANPNEPTAKYFREINPHMVEVKPNGDLSIVFPITTPEQSETLETVEALDFCNYVAGVYLYWVKPGTVEDDDGLTHNVSCTVTLKPGDLEPTLDWIWDHREMVKAMSFVSDVLDKIFNFAPRRKCYPEDEAKWNKLIENYKPVDWSAMVEVEDTTSRQLAAACAGNQCDQ
jgi:ribonucleoside-diphosphate reductase alpha chain